MEKRQIIKVDTGTGIFWFIGWLFSLAFAQIAGWKILLALFVWPYYLGLAVR